MERPQAGPCKPTPPADLRANPFRLRNGRQGVAGKVCLRMAGKKGGGGKPWFSGSTSCSTCVFAS